MSGKIWTPRDHFSPKPTRYAQDIASLINEIVRLETMIKSLQRQALVGLRVSGLNPEQAIEELDNEEVNNIYFKKVGELIKLKHESSDNATGSGDVGTQFQGSSGSVTSVTTPGTVHI